jgi:hypothetical protein
MLAFEGDSHVEWFEGNFQDYEEDKKRRLGSRLTGRRSEIAIVLRTLQSIRSPARHRENRRDTAAHPLSGSASLPRSLARR